MFYVSAILTILILIFSEIIPKTIGATYWKPLSVMSARVIQVLVFVTYPLLYIMNKITRLISRDQNGEAQITKEELAATVNMGEEAGILKQKDSLIIENLLHLNQTRVRDIYTPRKVVFALDAQELKTSIEEQSMNSIDIQKVKEYSRIPIYEGQIDNIIGVVLSKELFHNYVSGEKTDLIKPIYKINENVPVSKLLDLFISKKEHMFVVVDQYDQTEGIVTLEDAIETLLGMEIVDELDQIIDMQALAKQKY
jgi:CBS domain containing-hemolysin-like protein